MDLNEIHKKSFGNKLLILKSDKCGCFYCLKVFHSSKIFEWTDEGERGYNPTALCPSCGIDSVVCDAHVEITKTLLEKLEEKYFNLRYINSTYKNTFYKKVKNFFSFLDLGWLRALLKNQLYKISLVFYY